MWFILFVAFPIDHLYPQHIRHTGLNRQQMYLLIPQPELSLVVWREVPKAFLILNPFFVEVDTAIPSLKKMYFFTLLLLASFKGMLTRILKIILSV